ncbi:MAG: hydrogenase maturation nickel metallochaperone HypA [Candidatus Omnitrophica bacterium]|nr:hydrogenase maturation nickel metallochaperone HypA [Candidatus Omnitrophota bacterium]
MHELAFVEGIVQQVKELKLFHRFNRVREIEIICGPYNSVSADNLEFVLSHLSDQCLNQAKVSVRRVISKYFCSQCALEFDDHDSIEGLCPICHSCRSVVEARRAPYIHKLEVEDEN